MSPSANYFLEPHEFHPAHYKDDEKVDIQPINNSVLLTYFHGMKIAEHRDVCYTRDGIYHTSNNSQSEKSILAILAIGDSQQLKFHLYSQGRKMKKSS